MALGEKYRIDFKSGDGYDCRVSFFYEGYVGSLIPLDGGRKPFVLREFNSQDNIFKPIRAQLAEIEIVTNVNGVTIEDFYTSQDSDIYVIFKFNNSDYWTGYVLQDDFQEVWDDSNHYLIVKAADGFGLLKGFQLNYNGAELIGKFEPLTLLQYSMDELPGGFAKYVIINNLYHDSMSDASNTSPLDQCLIDAKTFQIQSTEYESCYDVISKINSSFNQTVFMYRNKYWFLRVEELYTSYNNNLRGYEFTLAGDITYNKRFDVEVGVNREVKPVMPEMLRLIQKKTKFDEVDFMYTHFDETLPNETFARGSLISSTASTKKFSISQWEHKTYTLLAPVNPTAQFEAVVEEIYDTTIAKGLIERYVLLKYTGTPVSSDSNWIRSTPVKVFGTNYLTFSVDFKQSYVDTTSPVVPIAYVYILSSGTYYFLDENGNWNIRTLSTARPIYLERENVTITEFNTIQIDSQLIPSSGDLYVVLFSNVNAGILNPTTYFKNLKVDVLSSFEVGERIRRISGANSKYEKTGTIVNSDQTEIFLDDHFSTLQKGAIFETGGTILTDKDWYRYRYLGESFGFRRQNATAIWEHNRFNRSKIDGKFYGLVFDDGGSTQPIGLINTIRFLDDDPNKVYWIANLQEIDYAEGTWTATLEEVFDEDRDVFVTQTFEADFTIGTYASPSTLPLTLVTSGGFSIQSGNTARYDGVTTLTTPVDCSIFGEVSCATYPTTVSFQLQKNGTSIKTINYPVYVANQAYTMNLSVTTQSIATNDTFKVVVTNASSINIDGGDMKINSPTSTITYDTYSENFIFE